MRLVSTLIPMRLFPGKLGAMHPLDGFAALATKAVFGSFLVAMSGCIARNFGSGSPQDSGNSAQQITSHGGDSSWDVNDISILYPLKKHGSEAPGRLVRLSEGTGLVSQLQFDKILELFRRDFDLDFAEGGQARLMNRRELWGVTAFRIHSCMQKKATDPCTPTVNIIAQPIIGNDSSTAEFAMHLVYLPDKPTLDLLQDMIAIRKQHAPNISTVGKPLGIHPALTGSQGLNSPFANAIRDEFLLRHLSHDKLLGIAVAFIEPNRLQPWVFFNTVARNMDQALDNSIFVFDPATSVNDCGGSTQRERQICRRDLASGKIEDSEEAAESLDPTMGTTPSGQPFLDNFLALVVTDADSSFATIRKDREKWQNVMNHIENPRLIGANETNCVSCHRPHTDRIRFRKEMTFHPELGPKAFVAVPGSGCTTGTSVDNATRGIETFNIRNFGYLRNEAIVSQRVQNETLLVCEQLKKMLK
jgi:hypothetical protein